jgi:hypothetical protein
MMKFYYYAILSITYLWGVVVAHRDASMRSLQFVPPTETGEFSVVILGQDNVATGRFCNVNGGKDNRAGLGFLGRNYAVSGGGFTNAAASAFSTISGGTLNSIGIGVRKHSTISGGGNNGISPSFPSSVITGGQANRVDLFGEFDFNLTDSRTGCTISGGENNSCSIEYGVATGGDFNAVFDGAAVAFGGVNNQVNGQSATSVGGVSNNINGDFSIVLGVKSIVNSDSSMVINLNDFNENVFDGTDGDGQFIVDAKSYTFQIGQNRDSLSFQITEDNIQNLVTALENAA